METIEQIRPAARLLEKKKSVEPIYLIRAFEKQAESFEKARFGWMAMLITFQSCYGAVSCMYISMANAGVIALASCAAVTMASNALFIALAKPRICLAGFYISVILNTVFLLMNL